MLNDTKKKLEVINQVSRQLLSQILAVLTETQENTTLITEAADDESITDKEIEQLTSKRSRLIHSLFENKSTDEISQELSLLNEMITLDTELSNQSKACKQALAEQLIKLKKSQKVQSF